MYSVMNTIRRLRFVNECKTISYSTKAKVVTLERSQWENINGLYLFRIISGWYEVLVKRIIRFFQKNDASFVRTNSTDFKDVD